ncbi:hypothetical protein DFP73DRAFT_556521 [Morchella snyderi]|nr:hypothetical protein DFP73DRAFT_556521 [Morchella snyderi]
MLCYTLDVAILGSAGLACLLATDRYCIVPTCNCIQNPIHPPAHTQQRQSGWIYGHEGRGLQQANPTRGGGGKDGNKKSKESS